MKTAYIFFSKQQPENNKTVLDLITHYCREHSLTYRILQESDCKTITIDGNDYDINLMEKNEESEPVYWMIYCSLKGRTHHLKSAVGA